MLDFLQALSSCRDFLRTFEERLSGSVVGSRATGYLLLGVIRHRALCASRPHFRARADCIVPPKALCRRHSTSDTNQSIEQAMADEPGFLGVDRASQLP